MYYKTTIALEKIQVSIINDPSHFYPRNRLYFYSIIQYSCYMGQVLQLPCKPSATKDSPINLQEYTAKAQLQNGTILMRNHDGSLHHLYQRQLQQSSISKQTESRINIWLNGNYQYICNAQQYQIKSRSLLCNSHLSFKVLIEHGEKRLYEIIEENSSDFDVDHSQITHSSENGCRVKSPLQMIHFLKLMIDSAEQLRQKCKVWTTFHTKSFIFFSKSKKFKHFYQPILEQSHLFETFFAPDGQPGANEDNCIFSMGMVLLCLFIQENCSDCYNYQHYTFCESVFQDKMQRLKEKLITKGLIGILQVDQSCYVSQFDEQMADLIFSMTQRLPLRISLAEAKRRYYYLIQKATLSYCGNRQESRTVFQPISSKRAGRMKMKRQRNPTMANFQDNENYPFKNIMTQIDDNKLFQISKSNIVVRSSFKSEGNRVVRWKNVVTNKMKEDKENFVH